MVIYFRLYKEHILTRIKNAWETVDKKNVGVEFDITFDLNRHNRCNNLPDPHLRSFIFCLLTQKSSFRSASIVFDQFLTKNTYEILLLLDIYKAMERD